MTMMQSQQYSKSCIACSQVKLYKTWLTCSTLVLAFSFSFSNTLKNLLEAIIYLFVVHPFDVGDGLFVGSTGTDYYKVHHLYPSQPLQPELVAAICPKSCRKSCLPCVCCLCGDMCLVELT